MEDNDAPMADPPPSNMVWLFSRLTRPERAMLVIYVAQGAFMLGMVCYREFSSGPIAGASAMAAMAVLLTGLGVWNATVSTLRRQGGFPKSGEGTGIGSAAQNSPLAKGELRAVPWHRNL